MPRDLAQSVVVITGASSGIGRAAAHHFAREGARLALAARVEEPLRATARECEALGAQALALPTDVRREDAVRRLAQETIERYGAIDVWVNCAGVIAYGRFDQVPAEVWRAVVETNLFGQVHGARAVVPHFRARGTGVLINMGSVWGRVTTPEVSAYVTSKFAVRAFSECLREELRHLPDVDVATMLPQAVDTPIFARGANFRARPVRPVPPVTDPDDVAEGILACARSPKREVTYGRAGRALELVHAVAPALHSRILAPAFEAGNYGRGGVDPGPGAVLDGARGAHAVRGGWRRDRRAELVRALGAALRGALRGAVRGR